MTLTALGAFRKWKKTTVLQSTTTVNKFRTKVIAIGIKTIKRLKNHHSLMDCLLRIKFYPSKFLDKVFSVDIIVRVSEYTSSAILMFLKFTGWGFAATSQTELQ